MIVNAAGAFFNNPIGHDSFESLFLALVNGLTLLLIPFCILAIVWLGFKMVLAQGKPQEIQNVKSALKWVVIGLFLVLAANGVIQVIQNTVNQVISP